MKTLSPLLLCLCAVLQASPSLALADDGTAGADGTAGGATAAQKLQIFKQAMAQIDLTDDQKQQIKQIRATVTDQVERHKEVMAVLTPEQKKKLAQFLQQYRKNSAANGDVDEGNAGGVSEGTAAGSGGKVGDGSDLAPGAN